MPDITASDESPQGAWVTAKNDGMVMIGIYMCFIQADHDVIFRIDMAYTQPFTTVILGGRNVEFGADECRIRTGNAAANFATIKHATINQLRNDLAKCAFLKTTFRSLGR